MTRIAIFAPGTSFPLLKLAPLLDITGLSFQAVFGHNEEIGGSAFLHWDRYRSGLPKIGDLCVAAAGESRTQFVADRVGGRIGRCEIGAPT